jgi:uncharacterized DUF497 family protein
MGCRRTRRCQRCRSPLQVRLNVSTFIAVRITFDPTKRARTFEERGLDFADAEHVFAGPTYTIRDERFVYPEPEGRFITAGFLATRMVIIAWTPIEGGRHIISMRKANDREQARYRDRFEQT